jgi:hypothetical protein
MYLNIAREVTFSTGAKGSFNTGSYNLLNILDSHTHALHHMIFTCNMHNMVWSVRFKLMIS